MAGLLNIGLVDLVMKLIAGFDNVGESTATACGFG